MYCIYLQYLKYWFLETCPRVILSGEFDHGCMDDSVLACGDIDHWYAVIRFICKSVLYFDVLYFGSLLTGIVQDLYIEWSHSLVHST